MMRWLGFGGCRKSGTLSLQELDRREANMWKKALFMSAAVVVALSLPASAGGPGGDDRGTRVVQF
jgi:hypothetical protein